MIDFGRFSLEDLKRLDHAAAVSERLKKRAVLVGGVVRDLLLHRPVTDWDIMADHPVEPLVDALAKDWNATIVRHPAFLTFTLHLPDHTKIDVVTAREETYPRPGRLPQVRPSTIENDLKRRDFTVNAMAAWLSGAVKGGILDLYSGREDLHHRLIRILHDRSFEDDPTRLFRAARFAGRLSLTIEPGTLALIKDALDKKLPEALTPTRRRHEFELLIKEESPTIGLKILRDWGALKFLDPGFEEVHPKLEDMNLERHPDYLSRLAIWYHAWGKSKAEEMMTRLDFEKKIKKHVLEKI